MRPRVLFLDHVAVLGGAELSLLDIVRDYGPHATVVLLEDGPFRSLLETAGVRTIVIEARPAVRLMRRNGTKPGAGTVLEVGRLATRVARIARDHDLIYANSQKAFVVGALAGAMARRRVIWHLRDILSGTDFSPANMRLAVTLANRLAARVVANSHATAEALVKAGGNATKLRVIHNGVDAAPFCSVREDQVTAARAELDLSASMIVGVFGRLAPWKGQHVLLDALPELPDVHAIVVGEALFGEQAYAEHLKKRAGELGIASRVRFLGFRSDIPCLMRLTDVVIHSSTTAEPFGRVIVEGMLAGRPVIASRGGGAVEIIEDGVSGCFVTPGDPRELAAAIRSLADPAIRVTLGTAARARAVSEFSLRASLAGVARQIDEVWAG